MTITNPQWQVPALGIVYHKLKHRRVYCLRGKETTLFHLKVVLPESTLIVHHQMKSLATRGENVVLKRHRPCVVDRRRVGRRATASQLSRFYSHA